MIPIYAPTRNKFIKDIAYPTIGDAITKSKKYKRVKIPVTQVSKSANNLQINSKGKITRVPPMAELHYYRPARSSQKKQKKGLFLLAGIPWLPKKYTASKGVVTDWHARTFSELKYAAPALITLYGLMLLALSWQLPEIKDYSSGHPKYVNSTSAGTGDQASSKPTPAVRNDSKATNPSNLQSSAVTDSPMQAAPNAATPIVPDPVVSVPPVTVDVPPIPTGGDDSATPPVTVEVPPITIDTPILDIQTPDVNLGH